MLAKIPLGGDVVEEQYIGNTHILFCDAAYAGKGAEEIQRVLDEAERASMNIILHQSDHP